MKYQERKSIRIKYATKAAISVLDGASKSSVGPCVVKVDLLPRIARRAAAIMDDGEYDPIFDTEAIPPPDERFVADNWKVICLLAAQDYQRFIIPSFDGMRLGTFEEYQKIPNERAAAIANGLSKTAKTRWKIINRQGGETLRFDVTIRQLESGEEE